MSNQNNADAPDAAVENPESCEEKSEVSRAKTPLERVREGQAKMRGQRVTSAHGSQGAEATSSANSYKRRLHQRKAG